MISDALVREIEDYAEKVRTHASLLQLARDGRLSPQTIATYLANIHFLIRHTPPFLDLARANCACRGEAAIAEFFALKAREEVGHDRWAEQDLATMSEIFGVYPAVKPTRSMKELVDQLRLTIEKEPSSYLAYVFFAEYFIVLLGAEWLQALNGSCGVPASALSVIGKHVELDKAHVAEGFSEIEKLVTDETMLAPLLQTLRRTTHSFDLFFDELAAMELGEATRVRASA